MTDLAIAAAEATAVLIGALAIVLGLRGVRNQLWLTTFSEYTRRYSEIVRDLPSEARRPSGNFDLSGLTEAEREKVLNAVRSYLNMCSEEYYLQKRGHIDQETWSIWRRGIEDTVRLPWISVTWSMMREEYNFYPEFCAFLDECIGSHTAASATS